MIGMWVNDADGDLVNLALAARIYTPPLPYQDGAHRDQHVVLAAFYVGGSLDISRLALFYGSNEECKAELDRLSKLLMPGTPGKKPVLSEGT